MESFYDSPTFKSSQEAYKKPLNHVNMTQHTTKSPNIQVCSDGVKMVMEVNSVNIKHPVVIQKINKTFGCIEKLKIRMELKINIPILRLTIIKKLTNFTTGR